MKFIIEDLNKSINDIMRTIGYKPTYYQEEREFSIVRQISRNDYPRFHLYISEQKNQKTELKNGKSFVFNLHLDQKKPSYKGSHGHSGEYEGDLVEEEIKRIEGLLS